MLASSALLASILAAVLAFCSRHLSLLSTDYGGLQVASENGWVTTCNLKLLGGLKLVEVVVSGISSCDKIPTHMRLKFVLR